MSYECNGCSGLCVFIRGFWLKAIMGLTGLMERLKQRLTKKLLKVTFTSYGNIAFILSNHTLE